MSHPDPNGPADTRLWRVGDELVNPVTGEYAQVLEVPWQNPEGRASAELLAVAGARVVGEHLHPAMMERFMVLDGELTVRLDGTTKTISEGESAEVSPGHWHDWWNATGRDIRVRVEVTSGTRFVHLIETLFGLAQLGHVDERGTPNPLQMAVTGREFADVVQFRSPPPRVQNVMFAALAPLSHAMGYRGTCPQPSRSLAGE